MPSIWSVNVIVKKLRARTIARMTSREVSYYKQIARQHSCRKNVLTGADGVDNRVYVALITVSWS